MASCRFRHLLEQRRLGEKIFQIVNEYLAAAVIRVQNGTIFDATIIQASTSRKTQQANRPRRWV